LLCDTDRKLGMAYGACDDPKAGYAKRISILIDEQGTVIDARPVSADSLTGGSGEFVVDPIAPAILNQCRNHIFRAGYQEIAEEVVVCLSPGINLEDPASFTFSRIRPGVRLRPSDASAN